MSNPSGGILSDDPFDRIGERLTGRNHRITHKLLTLKFILTQPYTLSMSRHPLKGKPTNPPKRLDIALRVSHFHKELQSRFQAAPVRTACGKMDALVKTALIGVMRALSQFGVVQASITTVIPDPGYRFAR
jgi:hypothetical protein